MDKVLIDTDVILDFFFDRKPFSENAASVLSLCESKNIKGFVTPVIISNCYYLLKQTASHKKVIDKLKQLLIIIDVLSMDKGIIIKAINSNFTDFEDALQNFTAVKHGGISVIITRNVKDYKKSEIGVLTPESYLRTKVYGA
ncbi:MAG: PIN domain-containing protein [Ignavibacteriae bacterium]|nr:PIN domain-containing protein [Ignavibacteriota bacterium]NOG99733.1 PIN domain-containing protein [Ignavibacteriota bacterium]